MTRYLWFAAFLVASWIAPFFIGILWWLVFDPTITEEKLAVHHIANAFFLCGLSLGWLFWAKED